MAGRSTPPDLRCGPSYSPAGNNQVTRDEGRIGRAERHAAAGEGVAGPGEGLRLEPEGSDQGQCLGRWRGPERGGEDAPAALTGRARLGRAPQVLVAADEALVERLDKLFGLDPALVPRMGLLPAALGLVRAAEGEQMLQIPGTQPLAGGYHPGLIDRAQEGTVVQSEGALDVRERVLSLRLGGLAQSSLEGPGIHPHLPAVEAQAAVLEGDGPGLAEESPQALEGGDEGSIGGIALRVRP